MRKDLIRCLVLLLSLALCGCVTHQGAIRATVTDAETGSPVSGAIVVVQWEGRFHSLVDSSTHCMGTSSTITDADGDFRIPSWTVFGYSISDVTGTLLVYKYGYAVTSETSEVSDRKQFLIRPYPAAVRARLSREYKLRHLAKSAEMFNGCFENAGHLNSDKPDDVYAPLRTAMTGDADRLANSIYDHYLVEKIRLALSPGYKTAIAPHIDIQKVSPSVHPSVGNWHDEDVTPTFTIGGAWDAPRAAPQLIVFCTKAVSGESSIDAGCDVNMLRDSGDTLLMAKADNGDDVEELLKRGADPGIQNSWSGKNALSSLLKSARKNGKYNDPSTLKAMRLLTADPRTGVSPEVRAELADPSQWRISEPAEKDFYLEVRERIKSLPNAEEIIRFDKSYFVDQRDNSRDEPFRLRCVADCDKPTGRWEYH